MAVLNLIALFIYASINNIYLYEHFYGNMEYRFIKGFFYLFTSLFLIVLMITELAGYRTKLDAQSNIIGKLAIIANYTIFSLTQLNFMPKPRMYFCLLNGSILAVTIIILTCFKRHGLLED